jgi:hypothetical protein
LRIAAAPQYRRTVARATGVRGRLDRLDWQAIESDLSQRGHARAPGVLTAAECRALIALEPDDRRFRSRIDMARFGFGVGRYGYFARPLPPLVAELRDAAYARLAPIANRWMEALRDDTRYPPRLDDFLARCASRDQTKPTPLLLRYDAGGYNCLHRDLYGDVAFPLQATCFLSRRGIDYEGGEFLLVEQRPRAQSRGIAIAPERGEMLIFPNAVRPIAGRRGAYRAQVRHGVSPLAHGVRHALGIIFHDAR